MRLTAFSLLAALVLLMVQGCAAVTPGQSPSQISASHSSAGFAERSYDSMQSELP